MNKKKIEKYKTCTCCGERKQVSEFYFDRNHNVFFGKCKVCKRLQNREFNYKKKLQLQQLKQEKIQKIKEEKTPVWCVTIENNTASVIESQKINKQYDICVKFKTKENAEFFAMGFNFVPEKKSWFIKLKEWLHLC